MKIFDQKKSHVALIGYGYWGRKIYATLNQILSSDNISVVEPNKQAHNKDIKVTTMEKVLSDKKISHVFIITPEETHFKIAKKCLKKNKNIFVEKPLCLKSGEAKELHTLAKKNNLQIYSDYIFLYDNYVKKIKSLLEKQYIGKLCHIESIRYSTNINKPNITVFDDLAIHDIYLGNYFFDNTTLDKTEVISSSICSNQINQAFVHYSYKGSKTLSAHYSWIQPEAKRIMTFIGEKGSIIWDRDQTELIIYRSQKQTKKIKVNNPKSALNISISKFLFKKNSIDYSEDITSLEKMRNN